MGIAIDSSGLVAVLASYFPALTDDEVAYQALLTEQAAMGYLKSRYTSRRRKENFSFNLTATKSDRDVYCAILQTTDRVLPIASIQLPVPSGVVPYFQGEHGTE